VSNCKLLRLKITQLPLIVTRKVDQTVNQIGINKQNLKGQIMSGWIVFLIIALVLGIIVSNIILLKQTAKMKVPDHVLKSIAERKLAEKTEAENKKPTNK
jgi:hypothetical protein